MVAMSRSISPQSRISRRLAPGGPASHSRPRNAVSPIRNCQNRRNARDVVRDSRAAEGCDRLCLHCTYCSQALGLPNIQHRGHRNPQYLMKPIVCALRGMATGVSD
jgi:hypothetical protein